MTIAVAGAHQLRAGRELGLCFTPRVLRALSLLLGWGMTLLVTSCTLFPGGDVEKSFGDPTAQELARAVAAGDLDLISRLVAGGADPDAAGVDGITMLQFAIRVDSLDGARGLLEADADPDLTGQGGYAPLHNAAFAGSAGLTQVLLDHDADPDVRRSGTDSTPLTEVCVASRSDAFELLVKAGADLNAVDRLGQRPILTCARTNKGALVLRLLQLGTDPLATNTRGDTFQDYYFAYDHDVLSERAIVERRAIVAWLDEHDVPLVADAKRYR